MNTRTDNTQNTAEEFRQAAKRLGDVAAYFANAIPWVPILKGTGKVTINILRYSMGIAIYGLIIWPYRMFASLGDSRSVGETIEEFGDSSDVIQPTSGPWDFDEESVSGNIHVSIGEGSFHISDHDRLDTI